MDFDLWELLFPLYWYFNFEFQRCLSVNILIEVHSLVQQFTWVYQLVSLKSDHLILVADIPWYLCCSWCYCWIADSLYFLCWISCSWYVIDLLLKTSYYNLVFDVYKCV